MRKTIINFIDFVENDDFWNYTRFELVELDNGKVFLLYTESDEYMDLDEDDFQDRWEIGTEIHIGSFSDIIKEGLEKGYFIQDDQLNIEFGALWFERTKTEEIRNWLGLEKELF